MFENGDSGVHTLPIGWSHSLEELKHSLRLYIACAGGVTAGIGMIAVKMIDVLEDLRDSKDPSVDLQNMATVIIRSLVDSVEQRLSSIGSVESIDLSASLADMKNKPPSNNLHHKQYYLTLLAQAHRDLSRLTNHEYPEVTNLDGDKL